MQEYYFLFFLALVWLVFASIQDLKTREVANWLNFSLIAFGLSYRVFYSLWSGNSEFFVLGLIGFLVFLAVGNLMYYSGAFAGGDAKLLMGLGAVIPAYSYSSLWVNLSVFLAILFFCGAVYSLSYSLILVFRDFRKFKKAFMVVFNKYWIWGVYSLFFSIIVYYILNDFDFRLAFVWLFLILPWLYIYLKAVEKSCLIIFVRPKELREGDWLNADIILGNKVIAKSVHGLSLKDIAILKKKNKSVWIKQGIPFVPAFLLSFLVMLYVLVFLELDFGQVFLSLF